MSQKHNTQGQAWLHLSLTWLPATCFSTVQCLVLNESWKSNGESKLNRKILQHWNKGIHVSICTTTHLPLPWPNINPILSSVDCCSIRGGVAVAHILSLIQTKFDTHLSEFSSSGGWGAGLVFCCLRTLWTRVCNRKTRKRTKTLTVDNKKIE